MSKQSSTTDYIKLFLLIIMLIVLFFYNNILIKTKVKSIVKGYDHDTFLNKTYSEVHNNDYYDIFDINKEKKREIKEEIDEIKKGKFICYFDPVFYLTYDINEMYARDKFQRHALLITSSILMDIIVYSSVFIWIFKFNDWVFFLALLTFYSLRQLTLSLFTFRFPIGYIFDYPNLPSLTVSYYKTNDFFYSGHVGIACIIFLEFKRQGINFFYGFCILFIGFLEGYSMIALRGHYFIDILYGVITAFYIYPKARSLEKYLLKIDFLLPFKSKRSNKLVEDFMFNK